MNSFLIFFLKMLLLLRTPWTIFSLRLGLLWHLQIGVSSIKFLGNALLAVATVLAFVTLRVNGGFNFANIADAAYLIFFGLWVANWRCQLHNDEAEEVEVVRVGIWFHTHQWVDWLAFWAYLNWGFNFVLAAFAFALARTAGNLLEVIYIVVALIATDLLIMTISGGKKGRLWDNIKKAFSVKKPQFVTNTV